MRVYPFDKLFCGHVKGQWGFKSYDILIFVFADQMQTLQQNDFIKILRLKCSKYNFSLSTFKYFFL